jgi:hypothetical protein
MGKAKTWCEFIFALQRLMQSEILSTIHHKLNESIKFNIYGLETVRFVLKKAS